MSRRTHGMLDYAMGALLLVAPWLLGFADIPAAKWSSVVVGAAALLYSMFTDYELGMVRAIPFSMHLMLDFGSGLFLALSPWLLGFAEQVYLPHLIFGLAEIGAVLMTRRSSMPRTATAGQRL